MVKEFIDKIVVKITPDQKAKLIRAKNKIGDSHLSNFVRQAAMNKANIILSEDDDRA